MVIKVKNIFRAYFFYGVCLFSFFTTNYTYAQENSPKYLSIKNNKNISNATKERQIDSLFSIYEKEESKGIQFGHDLYDFILWHYFNGDLDKAIATSKKCILHIEGLNFFDSIRHKKTYNNLGFFYTKKEDHFNAYKVYKKLATLGDTDSYTLDAYRLTGRNLNRLGDFFKAAEYYEKSIDIAKEIGNVKKIIVNSIDASINYKKIGTTKSLARGIEILNSAVQLANQTNDKANSEKDKIPLNDLFSLNNNLANLYNDRDDYDFKNSKLYYDISLDLGFKLKDSTLLSNVYNDLGYLYVQKFDNQALTFLDKALLYKPDKKLTSIIYTNKSIYFRKLKNYKEALYYRQKSINQLTPVSTEDITHLPSKESLAFSPYKYQLLNSLIDKAQIWISIYEEQGNNNNLINALETLKLADYLIEIIRFESKEKQSKLFWRKTATDIYTKAVKLCYYLDRVDKAFYFMEKGKALLLLEDLSLRAQRENTIMSERIHQRQFDLRREILNQTNALHNSEKKDSLRSLVITSKEVYQSFIDSLEVNFKFYYESQKPAQTIALNEAQKSLGEKSAIIEYVIGEDTGYGLLITKNKTKFFEIENYKDLLNLSGKFRNFIEAPLKTQKEREAYIAVAFSLYKSLFPDMISQEINKRKLLIIPDSYLQNIPFEALLTENKHDSYLIKKNEISYAYSHSFLEQNKNLERINENDFIGFAPINFKEGFSSLPQTKQEIETGSSLFSTAGFLYSDATTQNFIDKIKDHKIIHIASHSNASDTRSPWIVFDDRKLSLDELYLIENTADLVVLSACETSLGTQNKGEGVMSLARGFFNTGANSVLSTLWNVNDSATSKIIVEFYKQLKKGKTKSEALRLAKLDYLNSHQLTQQSPYFWSSLILIGDSGNIPIRSNSALYLILTLVILLFLLSIIFYKKIKK